MSFREWIKIRTFSKRSEYGLGIILLSAQKKNNLINEAII
ncbi:MAG: hypothetical protein ACJAVI_003695 [Candidatus Azotimanducaceae bacterium]|jgi:hypothetical protein